MPLKRTQVRLDHTDSWPKLEGCVGCANVEGLEPNVGLEKGFVEAVTRFAMPKKGMIELRSGTHGFVNSANGMRRGLPTGPAHQVLGNPWGRERGRPMGWLAPFAWRIPARLNGVAGLELGLSERGFM